MGDIESLIFSAWERIQAELLSDPQALGKRLQRRRLAVLRRPPRVWCLAVRACDHRILSKCAEPAEHRVTLTAALLRQVCGRVVLTAPGETLEDVATKLGTTKTRLTGPRLSGVFRSHYIPATMGRGHPVPLLYTEKPLDSAARHFAEADPMWLWTANHLATGLPDDFEQTLTRVPTFRHSVDRHRYDDSRHPEMDAARPGRSLRLPPAPPDHVWYKWSRSGYFLGTDPTNWRKSPQDLGERPPRDKPKKKSYRRARPSTSGGSLQFNGFLWLCPVCGKTCRTVYRPAPPLHLLKRVEPRVAQVVDVPKIGGDLFACGRCHRVRFVSSVAPGAWNQLIAYFTGGLLYGSEVPRPAWFVPVRKRAYRPIMRAAPRREHVRKRLLEGWTVEQIAAEMGIGRPVVRARMKEIFAHERVADRAGLARKFGAATPQPLNLRERARARLARTEGIILAGGTTQEIMRELAVCFSTAVSLSNRVFRKHGVRGRRGLEKKLGIRLLGVKRAASVDVVYG